MSLTEFLGGMFGTRAIEIVAATFGLINVVLIIRRSMWNYPFGIAMVILYCWIFYEARLYSDALLQIFFLVIQVFGIFWWLRGRDETGLVMARNLPTQSAGLAAMIAMIGTAALGYSMNTWTDAALPYWDACTTVLSVIAQILMARRYLQSWLVWITVDVLAIGIYLTKDLTPTAALYALFLCLSIAGYLRWRNSMAKGIAVAA
ncbi:MAG: nicotinamide mononucleotide transporter [Nitratireductor sp.]|nr:nicotinamide mononucleotide transporter [Nitratireductor sp.]